MEILTEEKVERACKRNGFSHPLIDILTQQETGIVGVDQNYPIKGSALEQQEYISRSFGFLADAVIAIGRYSLSSEDMIAVWSKVTEIMPDRPFHHQYHRHASARIICSAYSIQDTTNQDWKQYPRSCLETYKLPEVVKIDRINLLNVNKRLNELTQSLGEIELYIYGMPTKDSIIVVQDLARRSIAGDKNAEEQLEFQIAYERKHRTPILDEAQENIGKGLLYTSMEVQKALGW